MGNLIVDLTTAHRAELLGQLPQRMQLGVDLADGEDPAEDYAAAG